MTDVAQHAGVSIATVSRALSGTRPMSPEIRAHVQETAQRLGYQVNLVGRALRRRRSSTVGLIVPDLDNPFFSSLAQHLSRTFEPSAIDLLVFSADSNLHTERRGVQSFIGRQVDALVVIPCHETDSEPSIVAASDAVVTIQLDRQVPATGAHFVGCDNRHGMELIAEHIARDVDIESQPVVYVGATPGPSSGHERLLAFQEAFGLCPSLLGSFDVGWGQAAADALVRDGMQYGTVVAAADVIALGVLGRLHSLGFRVPEDFRVIGFDGIGVSHLAHPTLTTVRQPVEEISQVIRDLVTRGLTEEQQGERTMIEIKPELVLGESSPAAV